MITSDSGSFGRRRSLRTWLLFLSVASLPFLLRLHLDLRQTDQLAVQGIYRVWRWSQPGRKLTPGETVVFHRINDRSVAEELFLRQLQRDFKVVEYGDHPELRAYFDEGEEGEGALRARVELRPQHDSRILAWSGEHSRTDNGWILGPWLGAALFLMGKSPAVAALAGAGAIVLWDSGVSPLDIPARLVDFWGGFLMQMRARFTSGDWNASEMGRVPVLAFALWLPLLVAWLLWVSRRERKGSARARLIAPLALSLAIEPFAFWAASRFGDWEGGASWWKVYAGGFGYRFFLGGLLLAAYFGLPRELPIEESEESPRRGLGHRILVSLALPVAFMGANGWDWVGSILLPGYGETLVRLRFFLVGALLGSSFGSRLFGVLFSLLAFGIFAQPTTGHWNSSALYGLLMDGLLLGWWLSPFKPGAQGLMLGGRHALAVGVLSWVTGSLLSSVGVPLGVCWVALAAGVWVYAQTTREEVRPEGPSWKKQEEAWS